MLKLHHNGHSTNMKNNTNNSSSLYASRITTTNARVKTKKRRKYRLPMGQLLDVLLLYATHRTNDEDANAERTAKNQRFRDGRCLPCKLAF